MPHTFTIKLTNPVSVITLPHQIETTRMKILSLRYVTASASQSFLLLNMPDFNAYNTYFDPSRTLSYTKTIMLPPTTATMTYYENNSASQWDHVAKLPINIKQMTIEAKIDGDYNSDISSGNPLYIELYFE